MRYKSDYFLSIVVVALFILRLPPWATEPHATTLSLLEPISSLRATYDFQNGTVPALLGLRHELRGSSHITRCRRG